MNITIISNSLNCGGAERQIVYLAGLIKSQGHIVNFLCVNTGDFYKKILESYGINANMTYANNFSIALRKKNVFVRSLYVLIAKIKLILFVSSLKSDIVISFLELSNRINCISSFIYHSKVITGERNAIEPNVNSLFWKYYKFLMRRSDYIVCNSELAKQMWERLEPSFKNKLVTIYNIIYKPNISLSSKYYIKNNGKLHIVVPASYDNSRKNYTGLVSALKKMPEKYWNKLHIDWYGNIITTIENSPEYNETLSVIRKKPYSEMISFHNKVENIGDKMNSADFVAIFSHVEGLPNGICEAMSIGKPIIMTMVSDYNQLVQDNGFLCESHDPQSICDCLIKAIESSVDEIEYMGKKSKEIFNSLFSLEASMYKWNKLFK